MAFVSIVRAVRLALQNFWRNIWLSVVTVFILVLTLFSVSLLASVNAIGSQTIEAVREKVDLSVFFKADAPEEAILSMKSDLERQPDVESVTYVTKEEALEAFKARHAGEAGITEALEAVEGNPLAPHFVVKATSLDRYATIATFFDDPSRSQYVEDTRRDFEDSETIIDRLSNLTRRIEQLGLAVSLIFVVVSLLVVFNTIRITIYTHREEIGIMKLVGASNWFVRAPFLIESAFYALLAVLLSLAVLYPLLRIAAPALSRYFADYGLNLSSYFAARFWTTVLWQFGLAVLITLLSTVIATRKYLRV